MSPGDAVRSDPACAAVQATDKTLANARKVGLWTKADSVTLFDEINYGETK